MIEKDALEYIVGLKDEERIFALDGREYIKAGYTPVKDAVANSLTLHTLTGIKDFIIQNIDTMTYSAPFIIHIEDYNSVDLITELIGKWKQRETLLAARSFEHASINGRWKALDDFIIMLHSEFEPTEGSTYLKQITAGIVDSASGRITDNGITQTVTAKSGISLVEETEIKNPIVLKPYRTFPEIDQPDISFVFRIRKSGHGPECALFESDGGKWKTQTIQKIKKWFEDNLEEKDRLRIIA